MEKFQTESDELFNRCMKELMQLRKEATTNELIALHLCTFDDYVNWRKQFPYAEPWEFYLRPGAPDVISIRNQYEREIFRSLIEKKLSENK